MVDTASSSEISSASASSVSSSPHPTPHTPHHHNTSKPLPSTPSKSLKERMWDFYTNKYKQLLIIPFALMILCIGIIGYHYATTGDIITKDVSLKGGATITIPLTSQIDSLMLEHSLRSAMPDRDITVRGFGIAGQQQGVIISADVNINNQEELTQLLSTLSATLNMPLEPGHYGIEFFGSSLGSSFFKESMIIMLVAFTLMALVVFAYFRTFVPSLAIILKAIGVMLFALAFIDLFHIPIGTAGIAAFLMLIGYSVDTDILLTIRVLKRKEGTVDDRIASSIKTGLTITLIAMLAMAIGFFMAQSDVIRQIMLILFVGLAADPIFTWIQNVGMLRYYLEKKEKARL